MLLRIPVWWFFIVWHSLHLRDDPSPCLKQCPASFQPSDEDAVSLNVPMSNIKEEEQTTKEDPCHPLGPVKGLRVKDGEERLVVKF